MSVAGSTTSGKELTGIELTECFKGCDEVISLDADRRRILSFVESRMNRIAPNLVAIVGSSIAAQLVGLVVVVVVKYYYVYRRV